MKKRIILALALCTFVFSGFSQNANDDLLKKLVEKKILTQDEAYELGATNPQQSISKTIAEIGQSAKKIREGFNSPYLKFGGYGLLMYNYNEFAETHHDLRPRCVYFSAEGKLGTNFGYFVMADFVNPSITEFYGEWTPSNAFKLRGGQFKVPFTLENQLSATVLETVLNTRSVAALAGMTGDPIQKSDSKMTNKGGRDIGIQISGSALNIGSHDLLSYAGGLFQGTGINVAENNNTQDFAGTLAVHPVKNLRIAGGAYFGQAKYAMAGQINAANHVRNRWAISSDYQDNHVYARAEYIKGNDGGINKQGLHGMAMAKCMNSKLNFIAKVDYFNNNTEINSEVVDYTAAVNYYFYNMCRFQINYTYSDFNKKWDQRNCSAVQAQMQIVF